MRLQPGAVRDAINSCLLEADAAGTRVEDIHAAVEASIGQDVARSSVRSYLNINTPGRYERVGRGRYRLANV